MLILFIWCCATFAGGNGKTTMYTGAVVEYRPYNEWADGPDNILKNNTNTIVNFVIQGKNLGADIIVFPEYGLTGQFLGETNEDFLKLTQIVPEPKSEVIPCLEDGNNHTFEALRQISCAAREQKIYVVVSLAEWVPRINSSDEDVFHNTQVVFDRKGTVCARSRKKSLFFEDEFTPGINISISALFTTDFGVTFSLQTSFDIMYTEPGLTNVIEHGVKDILISAFWIDGLPFLTAPQIFSGWAEGLGVNVLISNYHIREKGGTGSGIFTGLTNATNSYVYEPNLISALILKNISTEVNDYENQDINTVSRTESDNSSSGLDDVIVKTNNWNESDDQFFFYENMINYTSVIINASVDLVVEHCHEEFCCALNYTMEEELTDAKYHLISFSGVVGRGDGVYKMYVQVCSLVYCPNSEITSCGNITGPTEVSGSLFLHKLQGTFETEFVYPSVMLANLKLMDTEVWTYTRNNGSLYSDLKTDGTQDNILAATLYGRYYKYDPL